MSPKPAVRPSRHSQGATALLALTTIALLSACNRAVEAPQPEVRPVRVIKIEKREGGDSIALTGAVQAQTEINLSFRIDGRMLERNVESTLATRVRPGQVVARLDSQNEQSSLQAARAQLDGGQGAAGRGPATTSCAFAIWSPKTRCRAHPSSRPSRG